MYNNEWKGFEKFMRKIELRSCQIQKVEIGASKHSLKRNFSL